jgi:hypothetical protein
MVIVPGQGLVQGQVGRIVITFPADPNAQPVVEFQAGITSGDFVNGLNFVQAFCTVLS